MAFQPLSVGDVLMLSQTAWKMGRAFTKGKKSAPAEFAEVEREANGLSEALKLVAETLHTDGSLLSQAETSTQAAVNTILESAGKTLADLESFVERYQVIQKKPTNGGFVVERNWTDVVVANYRTVKWTMEGGDITELRNMLQMHTNTINLTMQALQTRSLSRLEKTVMPMAENVADIHERVNGDLGDKIDDVHRIIMAVAAATPSLVAQDRAIDDGRYIRRASTSTVSTLDHAEGPGIQRALEPPPPSSFHPQLPVRQSGQSRHDSALSTPAMRPNSETWRAAQTESTKYTSNSAGPDFDFESGSPPKGEDVVAALFSSKLSTTPSGTYPPRRDSAIPRRESMTLPQMISTINEDAAEAGGSRHEAELNLGRRPTHDEDGSPMSRRRSKAASHRLSDGQPTLPPPAIPSDPPETHRDPATPSSIFGSPRRSTTDGTERAPLPPRPTSASTFPKMSSWSSFETALFRNAAILCDVPCTLVEYAQRIPDEPDPRYDTEMIEVCRKGRLCVVRRRENREHGGTRLATSIWTLSADSVRCQQKLPDDTETVPYCSSFDAEKVSIAPPSASSGTSSSTPARTKADLLDDTISLRFHGAQWTDLPTRELKTNWINYSFTTARDAIAFQSAIFGRMLLGGFRTTKTTVIHEGRLRGAFAFEEQFANIETLRLWEDDGVAANPGAQGGVLALLHVSSNFGAGWARWWINSSLHPVRIKEAGARNVRIKGIEIVVARPAGAVAKDAAAAAAAAAGGPLIKKVTGMNIEFKTEDERARFLVVARKAQERLLPLPDV